MKKSEALTQLNNSISSIFTKDDVIKLIQSLDIPESKPAKYEQLEMAILESVNNSISNIRWREVIEEDNIGIDLCGREIEVDCSGAIDLTIVEERITESIEQIFSDIRDSQEDEALETNLETNNNEQC